MIHDKDMEPQDLRRHTSSIIANALRGIAAPWQFETAFSLAYCALLAKKFRPWLHEEDPCAFALELVQDGPVADFLMGSLSTLRPDDRMRVFDEISSRALEDGLEQFILDLSADSAWDRTWHLTYSTPADICRLALRLLDPKPGSSIGDFGSGVGSFLLMARDEVEGASLFGVEINRDMACISRIRLSISRLDALAEPHRDDPEETRRAIAESLNADIRVEDMLYHHERGTCDYAFSNYPLGMRTAELREVSEFAHLARSGGLGYRRPTTADWVFNHYLVDAIGDDGRAVALMAGGACFNTTDSSARRYFIEQGLVESVISLPARLFPGTNMGLNVIVLSRGNAAVRMVDASDLVQEGRRTNSLSDDAIDEIAHRLACDVEGRSRGVGAKELSSSDYVLSPSRYLQRPVSIRNARKLGEVVHEIRRGATLRAGDLDDLAVSEATDCRYLMLRDIQDGTISDELPCLGGIDGRLERHCIGDGDVLLSKNGAPFKVAVAEVPEGTRILANGNLYIIRVDREVIDPYYLAAFLGSNKGMEVLSSAVVGVTIPSIPLRNLRDVPIPVPPLEEQRETVVEYQAKLDEVRVLRMRAQRAIDEARSLFDGED